MKKTWAYIVLLVLVTPLTGYAAGPLSGWSASIDMWMANTSNFDENPGPETAGHVWGDFPTTFYSATITKDIITGVQAEVRLGTLTMNPSTMYLHSEDLSTEFDGSGMQFLGRLNYHLLDLWGLKVDVGAGYHTVSAVKNFYNQTSMATVVQPGNWGEYKIQYSGPVATLKASWKTPMGFGVGGHIDGAPMITNHTEVFDGTNTTLEDASGLRYCMSGHVSYSLLPFLDILVGYQYEDIYFEEPSPDSFDLAIKYSGFFAKTILAF